MTSATTDRVRFLLDGKVVELRDVDPTRTVLQHLREDLHRTGSKEGCAEGDCGACTVVLVDLDAGGELRGRAINACIQFLPTLDGKELLTVESLRSADGSLHPVQQAMVDCHASQCGFCTPGFVMSMFALYKNASDPGRVDIDDALAGNLCRCTGYRPIIDAARDMYRRAPAENGNWMQTAGTAAGSDTAGRVALLQSIAVQHSVAIEYRSRRYFAPRTAAELAALFKRFPDATLLAGGTDVGLWVTKQQRELDTVIYTGQVEELHALETSDDTLSIGAAVSLSDAMPVLIEHFPELDELLRRFASPPIRNAGTLGGNVANGSPIGDSMPALLAAGASLRLTGSDGSRSLPLEEFYLDYMKNALRPGEFVERIDIPLPLPGDQLRSYKVSKRFDQDISAVCGAYRLRVEDGIISDIAVACGGLAAIPKRAAACEKALRGQPFAEASFQAAMQALDEDFSAISDMRASDEYRQRIAKNLLLRFYRETADSMHDRPVTRVYRYGRA